MQNQNYLGNVGCLQCGEKNVELFQFYQCEKCLIRLLAQARKIIDRFRKVKEQ